MKLVAHYDVSGKIHSVTWVSAPQGHNLTGSPSEKTLRDIANSHTIAEPITRCTLAKKQK
jgi:hypothetical protein